MMNERALRVLIFHAVEGWLHSQPQLVHAALAHVLAGLVLASHPRKIINEAEVVSELKAQLLDYLHFSVGAIGAQDSN